jgi:hypothetical protein
MHATSDLAKLHESADHRFVILQQRLESLGLPLSPADQRELAITLIDAQNTWQLFIKFLFISSAIGARRASGKRARAGVPGITSPSDAIAFAIKETRYEIYKRKSAKGVFRPLDEPGWHLSWVLPKLARAAKLSNESQILVAWAVPGQAIDHLLVARNFFAHRAQHTASDLALLASVYRVPTSIRPALLPAEPHPSSPFSIAFVWLAQLRSMVRLLAQ